MSKWRQPGLSGHSCRRRCTLAVAWRHCSHVIVAKASLIVFLFIDIDNQINELVFIAYPLCIAYLLHTKEVILASFVFQTKFFYSLIALSAAVAASTVLDTHDTYGRLYNRVYR